MSVPWKRKEIIGHTALYLGDCLILTWDKGAALGMGALDLPWKPCSEEIYVIGRGFAGVRDEGNVLYCPPVQSMAKNARVHPNQKPIVLITRLLRKLPVDCILDPFMGSGSVGVACVNVGRRFIGIEIEEKYFDIAYGQIAEPRPTYRQADLLDIHKTGSKAVLARNFRWGLLAYWTAFAAFIRE